MEIFSLLVYNTDLISFNLQKKNPQLFYVENEKIRNIRMYTSWNVQIKSVLCFSQ